MGVFGSIVFFGFLAAVIIVPQVLRSRDRQRMFETMRAAYERGQPVPPQMVDMLTPRRGRDRDRDFDPLDYVPESSAGRDLRRGVVWTAVGAGFFLIGLAFYAGLYNDGGAAETFGTFAAIGAIPLCIGVAFLGLWWFGRRAGGTAARAPMSFADPAAPPPYPQAPGFTPPPPPPSASSTVPRPEI